MLKAGTDLDDFSAEELINLDYNYKTGLIDLNIGLESILCRYCS